MKIAVIFGTRPEAIKMAPVVKALQADPRFSCQVWSTGQHRSMLDQAMAAFGLTSQADLRVMSEGQGLNGLFAAVMTGVDGLVAAESPDMVLVHGDTTTAAAASIAAFHRRIPVGHVEAGLRSGRMDQPWPEEFNRRLVDMIGHRLFAPTLGARQNLLDEGVPDERIVVTGNTVVDALLDMAARVGPGGPEHEIQKRRFDFLRPGAPMVLVTGHRRESFGEGFRNICKALRTLATEDHLEVVFPVHLNPQVAGPVHALLGGLEHLHLIDPADYPGFVYLMGRSSVILTDSGGVQEEAPSLGKPILVMRDVTERPEAIAAGVAELVGTQPDRIIAGVRRALTQPARGAMINPYGDGQASGRIVRELHSVADHLR